jgi:hypothetical protein
VKDLNTNASSRVNNRQSLPQTTVEPLPRLPTQEPTNFLSRASFESPAKKSRPTRLLFNHLQPGKLVR